MPFDVQTIKTILEVERNCVDSLMAPIYCVGFHFGLEKRVVLSRRELVAASNEVRTTFASRRVQCGILIPVQHSNRYHTRYFLIPFLYSTQYFLVRWESERLAFGDPSYSHNITRHSVKLHTNLFRMKPSISHHEGHPCMIIASKST